MTDEIEHDKPDAITRLRAENERLGRDYQTARNAHDKLVLKIERLRAALEKLLWYTNQLELAVYDPAEWPSTHWAVRAARAALEGGRSCTCHPSEAPTPCQQKYALGECIKAALEEGCT